MSDREIRVLGFKHTVSGRFAPTRHLASFWAPVDTSTGELVEPTPNGWEPINHPPAYEPAEVLAFLREGEIDR